MMDEDDAKLLKDGLESIAHQLCRIADLLQARDKAERERREAREILVERIAEAEALRRQQQRLSP